MTLEKICKQMSGCIFVRAKMRLAMIDTLVAALHAGTYTTSAKDIFSAHRRRS